MRILEGNEYAEAAWHMLETAVSAREATCQRGRCGTHIVKDGQPIGVGSNNPPHGEESRKCHLVSSLQPNPRHDQTCCVHAEWEAILDALVRNPDKVRGSTLYFTRVDERGELLASGKPYCTICSRLALRTGIAFFVLWHEEGITEYDTMEYNNLSYEYERLA